MFEIPKFSNIECFLFEIFPAKTDVKMSKDSPTVK